MSWSIYLDSSNSLNCLTNSFRSNYRFCRTKRMFWMVSAFAMDFKMERKTENQVSRNFAWVRRQNWVEHIAEAVNPKVEFDSMKEMGWLASGRLRRTWWRRKHWKLNWWKWLKQNWSGIDGKGSLMVNQKHIVRLKCRTGKRWWVYRAKSTMRVLCGE